MRKIVVVFGKMGSGKTTFCKKIIQKTLFSFPHPISYLSVDDLAKSIRDECFSYSNTQWKKLLFYHFQSKKNFNILEKIVHPILQKKIKHRVNSHKKGTLLIDIALDFLLPQNLVFHHRFLLPSKQLFPLFIFLKKQRKWSNSQIFELLRRQKKRS